MAYSSAIFDVYVYEAGYTEVSVIKGTVSVEEQYGNTKVNPPVAKQFMHL